MTKNENQDTAANLPTVKPCGTPSTALKPTFRDVARRLDTESQTGLERVVSVAEANAILSEMIGRDEPCSADDAVFMARNLIGLYPAREVHDATAYAAGVTAVLASHPLDFVRRVCSPVHGLPSRLKWLPTIADVTEALHAERAKRDRIATNARYVIASHDARKREAEEREAFEADRLPAEERARVAAEAISRFKAMPVAEPMKERVPGWRPSAELLADLERRKAERLATKTEFPEQKGATA